MLCLYLLDLDLDNCLLTSSHFIKVLMNDSGAFPSWLMETVELNIWTYHIGLWRCASLILELTGHVRVSHSVQEHYMQQGAMK